MLQICYGTISFIFNSGNREPPKSIEESLARGEVVLWPELLGRLGNHMFIWAAAWAMAREAEAAVGGTTPVVVRLVVSRGSWLYQTYGAQLDAIALEPDAIHNRVKWTLVAENNVVYDASVLPKLIDLVRANRSRTLALRDSRFQSWRYFHPKHTAHIVRQFVFPDDVLRQSLEVLSALQLRTTPMRPNSTENTRAEKLTIHNARDLLGIRVSSTTSGTHIAAHVRLTDHSWNIGTRVPSRHFFITASQFFNKHFSDVRH